MKGIYVLIIHLKMNRKISIGKLGLIEFKKGIYFYAGSAFNGIQARVKRHLKKNKKLFWHIDYFLKKADILGVLTIETNDRKAECKTAQNLKKCFSYIKNFGSSDCDCISHLFYYDAKNYICFLRIF